MAECSRGSLIARPASGFLSRQVNLTMPVDALVYLILGVAGDRIEQKVFKLRLICLN
jgi:hypothetical protein